VNNQTEREKQWWSSLVERDSALKKLKTNKAINKMKPITKFYMKPAQLLLFWVSINWLPCVTSRERSFARFESDDVVASQKFRLSH